MRKRVALAQSLINEPQVLLMDEPFSALDVQTRSIMSDELLALWDLTRPAVVFVTHDLEEAIALADKVVVLTAGPGRVKATFRVDLPRPRKAQEIRFTDEFVALYPRSGRRCAPRSRPRTPARRRRFGVTHDGDVGLSDRRTWRCRRRHALAISVREGAATASRRC